MADSNLDIETPQIQAENQPTQSPPPSPPIASATESDLKLPKKREREVSLEPATPKADFVDIDTGRQEGKERRTPAKKNRIHLDATEEEDDAVPGSRASSRSPPLSTSPPHEVKVRQISQGVEDLTWQHGMKKIIFEDDAPPVVVHEADSNPGPETDAREPAVTDEDAKVAPDDTADILTSAVHDDATNGTDEVVDDHIGQAPPPATEAEPDSGDKEKGIKRKYGARMTSGGILTTSRVTEPLKRPRDDPGEGDDPRVTKKPSPPPSPEPKPVQAPSPTPKLTGFMSYATTSSPFGAVKGRNIFTSLSKTSPASPFLSSSTSSFPGLNSGDGESLTPVQKTDMPKESEEATPKLSGFESYMSTGSPFASAARSKSPPLGSRAVGANRSPTRRAKPASFNAFSSYASGGIQGFHVPKRARASSPSGGSSRSSLERPSVFHASPFDGAGDSGGEEEEEDRPVSFGEKLRAGRDEEEEPVSDEEKGKFNLTEQEVITGEEDEDTMFQVRGKLYSLSSQNQWKERGTGMLKLNVRRDDGAGARLVMRKDAVYALLLNVTLFKGMRCFLAQDPRYLRFSVIENGATVHYNLRVASAKVASELLEEINSNIPTSA